MSQLLAVSSVGTTRDGRTRCHPKPPVIPSHPWEGGTTRRPPTAGEPDQHWQPPCTPHPDPREKRQLPLESGVDAFAQSLSNFLLFFHQASLQRGWRGGVSPPSFFSALEGGWLAMKWGRKEDSSPLPRQGDARRDPGGKGTQRERASERSVSFTRRALASPCPAQTRDQRRSRE